MATNNSANFSEGTTGQLLVATTNTAPSFTSSATGDFTFTSTTASQTRVLTVSNTDNTAAATSAAKVQLTVGGSNVGDPTTSYTVTGVTKWTKGVDNSVSDSYRLSASGALETTVTRFIRPDGEATLPLQPAFLGIGAGSVTNVTGAGTTYGPILTYTNEIFDQNSDYTAASCTFTAPVGGRYQFRCQVSIQDLTSAMTSGYVSLVTSNRTYNFSLSNVFSDSASNTVYPFNMTSLTDMDAADTCYPAVTVSNGAGDTADIQGTFSGPRFSGYLVC